MTSLYPSMFISVIGKQSRFPSVSSELWLNTELKRIVQSIKLKSNDCSLQSFFPSLSSWWFFWKIQLENFGENSLENEKREKIRRCSDRKLNEVACSTSWRTEPSHDIWRFLITSARSFQSFTFYLSPEISHEKYFIFEINLQKSSRLAINKPAWSWWKSIRESSSTSSSFLKSN